MKAHSSAKKPLGIEDISDDEFESLCRRARSLSIAKLDELVKLVGISLAALPGKRYLPDRDSYINLLDEADDLCRVYDFLDRHGV